MSVHRFVAFSMFAVLCSASLLAQTVTKGDVVKASATIQALDMKNRLITLRLADGTEETMLAGPEIKRFDALKVGDKVTLAYYESRVFSVRKPGAPAPAAGGGQTVTTPAPGAQPGATMARQATMSVTVKAVDPSVPSITVTTPGGRTVIRKVERKADLEGVKPGDTIDITVTQALVAS